MSGEEEEDNLDIVWVDGEPLINLDESLFRKSTRHYFPFNNLISGKQVHFAKVLEELHDKFPIRQNIIPFDIFIIDIKPKTEPENEDDCESE